MHSRFVAVLMLVLALSCALAGYLLYPHLPEEFISHWNAAGVADGFTTPVYGVILLPGIMLILMGVWAMLPHLDPLKGIRQFRYVYDFVFFLILALLAYVYALMLMANLDASFKISTALLPALALFFFVIGALMPRMRRNWFMGIRTPWTLSSDHVWKKTHELGSQLFMGAGILMLLGLFFPGFLAWVLVLPIAIAALVSVVYSYLLFREEQV